MLEKYYDAITATDSEFTNSVTWPDGSTTTTSPASGITGEPHFLCYESGGTYYVENAETGSVVSSGSSADTQLQYAFDNLPATSARPIVRIRDEWYTGSEVTTTQANFAIDARGAYIEGQGDFNVLRIETNDVWLYGGIWDGTGMSNGSQYNACISVANCDRARVFDALAQNSGYYGVNIYETNDSHFARVASNNNYRHGLHPGTDTAGRNEDNTFIQCVANNNGEWGFNDRHGTGDYCGNTYIGCVAHNNSKNGIGAFDNSGPSTNFVCTFVNCVATGNDKNYKLEDGNHVMYNCISDGAVTSGVETNDRSNPSSANVHIQMHGCSFLDSSGTGVAWGDTNLTMHGGQVSSYYDGSSVGIKKFNEVDGIGGSDANTYVWVDNYAAEALGGASPTASDYETGMTVEDSNNAGTLYYITPNGAFAI